MRILLIEDEATLAAQVRERLLAEGHAVDVSGDGREGLYLAQEYPVDLAIVDLGLPNLPGLDLIRSLRAEGRDLPILILTARGKWEEKVTGLEAGADDYLVKPFVMEELLARVRALLRRAAGGAREILVFGPLSLDVAGQQVRRDDRPLELTTFEYRLLEYLARRAGQVVPKRELADYLYPHDEDPDSNVIEVLMGRLRRKLDPDGNLRPIETLRGRGYRFVLKAA
ncbi:MAG: response regulator transcription factor [Ectothiorhodospiraceae bacterium]|jgi:two-component system response regulator PhoP|nr:response regulator transcription factor [Ectothiorhodospiraceae bacterium]